MRIFPHPLAATPLALTTLSLAAIGAFGFAGSALAAGTSAGTLITNTATATFTSGAATGSVTSNTVTVKVDDLINVAVAGLNGSPVASNTSATLSYSVTNPGNGAGTFTLTADPAVAGNAFNGTIQTIAVDSNGNGIYDPGIDTVVANGAASPSIPVDGSIKVFVIVSLPTSATDGQTSQVRLTAASTIGTGAPGTVFAGRGVGGSDAVVGLTGAQANGLDAIVASLASVTLTKSAAIADPFGGTTPVPGATVTYALVSHVTGSGTANGVQVTDSIPAGTTYQAGSLTLAGTALTDASDGDAGAASASGISVSLGNIVGGSADKTVTFKVKIN